MDKLAFEEGLMAGIEKLDAWQKRVLGYEGELAWVKAWRSKDSTLMWRGGVGISILEDTAKLFIMTGDGDIRSAQILGPDDRVTRTRLDDYLTNYTLRGGRSTYMYVTDFLARGTRIVSRHPERAADLVLLGSSKKYIDRFWARAASRALGI